MQQLGFERCVRLIKRDAILFNKIPLLETLTIFGLRADYMKQFEQYLQTENIDTQTRQDTITLPIISTYQPRVRQLSTLALSPDMVPFRKSKERPQLGLPQADFEVGHVVLNWYPKVQRTASEQAATSVKDTAKLEQHSLTAMHTAFFDMTRIYFEVLAYKRERGWHHLEISQEVIEQLLARDDWYTLYVPGADLRFDRFERVRTWEEIAVTLLKKYCAAYYHACRKAYESPYLRYMDLAEAQGNFIKEYRITFNEADTTLKAKLLQLRKQLQSGQMQSVQLGNLHIFDMQEHLYLPLIAVDDQEITVSPVQLNPGEHGFVMDLQKYCQAEPALLKDKQLYLLRNQSRGKGIGFFEAGNFHPDFMLWVLHGEMQYLTFIDPKGIRNLSIDDKKIEFATAIKQREEALRQYNPDIVLHSFILSQTKYHDLIHTGTKLSKEEMEAKHVLFVKDDHETYIEAMLQRILTD